MEKSKKAKRGFSLVELIIVMAIMVALVAVLAPQFTKYVQKARNTVVLDAANQAMSMVKSEYAIGELTFYSDETSEATVSVTGHTGHLDMELDGLKYSGKTGEEAATAFAEICGIDKGAKTKSDVGYKIIITRVGNGDEFSSIIECAINVEMDKMIDGEVVEENI